MKIKLGDAKTMWEGLAELKKQKKKFPIKVKFAITQNVDALEKEASSLEIQRIELCEMYANKDKDGKPIIKDEAYDIPEGAKEELNKEYSDLKAEEVEVDIRMVPIEEFDKCENEPYEMPTWEDLYAMRFMIEG